MIDQRALPHALVRVKIADADAAALAIRKMWVRGAPLIGAVGAYGLALALDRDASDAALAKAHAALDATRPTAVNLRWALDRVRAAVAPLPPSSARRRRVARSRRASPPRTSRSTTRSASTASRCCVDIAQRRSGPVSVMTHCNAGALATCGWGTATAPLFLAHAEGLPLHVWVSETRPRLQGANLTAWELRPARACRTRCSPTPRAALLMRRGDVDIVIVGADRVAAQRRRLQQDRHVRKGARRARQRRAVLRRAAVADARLASLATGDAIPIETRDSDEVLAVAGRDGYGQTATVAIAPERRACGQLLRSTSRRRGSSRDSSPSAASPPRTESALARDVSGTRDDDASSDCAKR